ncbi:tetratricopeptide repeat protein [Actinophytocola oryzae]|uniref:tetratricopeptide repeat protein n=1 Tax=Actinophytocola oryzae TaxID=502181 RepID=UPI0010632851|nr:hypothetical protein [Actinophytocola oryzae]
MAVAVGNGSLLGVGYWLLGRRAFAVVAALVTLTFAILLATAVRELWLEIVVVVWWVAVIAHGWILASRGERPTQPRRQRLVAIGVTAVVLLLVGGMRFDAARIDDAVADARNAGNCTTALDALDARTVGHRIADAPLTAKGDDTVRACDLLHQANAKLDRALDGDTVALRSAVDNLHAVLDDLPGHEVMAEKVLGRFLDRLPTDDACDTTEITDWLSRIGHDKSILDRAADIVPKVAPLAIVECGDQLMSASDFTLAREHYQQLLDRYPDDDLAPRAQEGVTKATQAIELANVRQLLSTTVGTSPAYCTRPAPYSGATPYGATRPNRALFYGNDEYTSRLPAEWKATDAADAVIIVCAGATEYGPAVETCPYEAPLSPFGYTDVTFKKISIPVRVFEVKTARVIVDVRVEIGGASCPAFLEYRTIGTVDLGPPSEVYVTPSDPDVHAGFTSLVNP